MTHIIVMDGQADVKRLLAYIGAYFLAVSSHKCGHLNTSIYGMVVCIVLDALLCTVCCGLNS